MSYQMDRSDARMEAAQEAEDKLTEPCKTEIAELKRRLKVAEVALNEIRNEAHHRQLPIISLVSTIKKLAENALADITEPLP